MNYLKFSPTITPTLINNLQNEVNKFINLMADSTKTDTNTIEAEFTEIIQNITNIVFGEKIQNPILEQIIKALINVRNISNISVTIYESDGKTQTPVQSSLSSLLLKTLTANFHSVRDKCKSYDVKNNKCKFGNKLIDNESNEHLFVCDFHLYDSVSMHLVLACLYNLIWTNTNNDPKMTTLAAFFGLYHDIAKPLSVETYEFKGSIITGFPGHAEIGAMMVQMHWSPNMLNYISKEDYMIVVTAILRHMCGYHGDHNKSNSYKRSLLLLEQHSVRTLLTINRIGDHFGKLTNSNDNLINEPSEHSDETNNFKVKLTTKLSAEHTNQIDHFLLEQELFEKHMKSDVQFNLPTILKTHTNKHGEIVSNKIVLFIIGTSGAGKTYWVNEFSKKYSGNVSVVSRDKCIAEVCVGMTTRLENKDYINMYKIYEAGKKLEKLSIKPKYNKQQSNAGSAELNLAKENLAKSQIEWNNYIKSASKNYPEIHVYNEKIDDDPHIPARVKTLYEKCVQDGLKDSNLFLILDTFMNCFPIAVESNVPNELKHYFRVHVHIQNYLFCKESSIADSIENQLKISGPYGILDPIHPDGFRNGKNKKAFASLSSEISTEESLPRSTFTSRFRPHLVAGICTRTLSGNIGYEETFTCLDELVRSMIKKVEFK